MRLGNNISALFKKNYLLFFYSVIPSVFFFLKQNNFLNEFFFYSELHRFRFFSLFLKNSSLFQLSQLCDISVLDFLKPIFRFKLIYNFQSIILNIRLFIIYFIPEKIFSFTLRGLFRSSEWLEREVWDMFGIPFEDNYNLRRILTDYGFKGFPLRKDFPLTGYIELRYNDDLSLISYEPVELSQELRFFNFSSGWERDF